MVMQALTLLNDPTFVEAARVLAENIVRHGGSKVEERIDSLERIDGRVRTVAIRVPGTNTYLADGVWTHNDAGSSGPGGPGISQQSSSSGSGSSSGSASNKSSGSSFSSSASGTIVISNTASSSGGGSGLSSGSGSGVSDLSQSGKG